MEPNIPEEQPTQTPNTKSCETRVRVRYAETDQMGVVYYANYLVWMELARTDYCRAMGIRYRDMEVDDGILIVVSEANCQYRRPARYDDEVIVTTWISEASTRGMRVDYDMHEAVSGGRIAKGYTKHVFCGRDVRPMRLPEKYWAVFGIEEKTAIKSNLVSGGASDGRVAG